MADPFRDAHERDTGRAARGSERKRGDLDRGRVAADTDLQSAHLRIDWRDRVWLVGYDHDEPLGYIDADPEWPESLGPEPKWFLTELGDLLDQWTDARADDYRGEVLATYERGIGART